MVERDPPSRSIQTGKAHEKMRLYGIGPNYMRPPRLNQSLQLWYNASVKASVLADNIALNPCAPDCLCKLALRW